MDSGQVGIQFREALVAGRGAAAAELVPRLDDPHRIELGLGAGLRDARGDFAAARAWVEAEARRDWVAACALLAAPGADHALDEEAAAFAVARRLPERWVPAASGAPGTFEDLLDRLAAGRVGWAFLGGDSLSPAVALYYRAGPIQALGVRPLLVLGLRRWRYVSPPSTTKV